MHSRRLRFTVLPPPSGSLAQRRAVAESVRAPWTTGGPRMARIVDRELSFAGESVAIRMYVPSGSGSGARPALVYMHGGGWTIFSLDTHDRVMREYAARTGAIVIGVDYARSPEAKFPRAIEQIVAVVGWLAAGGVEGMAGGAVDARRIVLAGDSAGANLALAAALALRGSGALEPVRALILNYGAFHTDFGRTSHRRFGGGDYLLSTDEMRWMWSQYLRSQDDEADPLACPLLARLHDLPPTFMAIAELDILHDENIELSSGLRAAGVPVEAVVYPGTVHGFLEAVSIARVSDRALADTARWLEPILRHGGRHLPI